MYLRLIVWLLAVSFPWSNTYGVDNLAFKFDVASNVPESEVAIVREGLAIAEDYLNRVFGGAIPPKVAGTITIRIEATGNGNQGVGGGGACCTGLDANGPRPYFDVKHPQWAQETDGRGWTTRTDKMKSVIHEYTHAWQSYLGAMTMQSQPLGNWINEGIAEFVAYSALVDAGKLSQLDADRMEFNSARGDQLSVPLATLQTTDTSFWVGHVGYLAIQWLVAESPNGPLSLRILATEIAAGIGVRQAFATAFGVELYSFYKQFEAWRKLALKDPTTAFAGRPRSINVEEREAVAASSVDGKSADELYQLGFRSDIGDGVEQNDAEAVRWYLLAAKQGQVDAQRNLAGMYGSGRGVVQNDAEAKRWFRTAAEAGDAQAQYALANWYIDENDEKIGWLRKAAAQKHAEAIAALQQMGVAIDLDVTTETAINSKETEYALPSQNAPLGGSKWQWSKDEKGMCVVWGEPTETDDRLPRDAKPNLYFVNSSKGDPNSFGVNFGTYPEGAESYLMIDGFAYPLRNIGKLLFLKAKSVSPAGTVLDFSYSATRFAGKALVAAMRAGNQLSLEIAIVRGPTAGAVYRDVYSLDGFASAKAAADAECQGIAEAQMEAGIGDDAPIRVVEVATPAATPIDCVQQELKALGFSKDDPTGKLDKKTIAASNAAKDQLLKAGWDLPILDKGTALAWCLQIAHGPAPSLASIAQQVAAQTTFLFGLDADRANMPAIVFMASGIPLLRLNSTDLQDEMVSGKKLQLATVQYTTVRDMDGVCFEAPAGFDLIDKDGERHDSFYCSGRLNAVFLASAGREWFTLKVAKEPIP